MDDFNKFYNGIDKGLVKNQKTVGMMCWQHGVLIGRQNPQTEQAEASSLSDLLSAKELLEHENTALTKMVTDLANYYMESDYKGRFMDSVYAEPVNKLLGI